MFSIGALQLWFTVGLDLLELSMLLNIIFMAYFKPMQENNKSWQVLPVLLFTLMHIHVNLYRNASIYRGKIRISLPQKV